MLAQPQSVFYRAWARTSATLEEDFTNHVATLAAPSGETFVAGSTKNAAGTYSMILSRYQASGLLAWETEFTVNDTGNVHVGSIALDASGNILVVGSAYNGATNGYDLLLVKFDDSGNEIWHQLHNGPANSYDFGAAVACDATNDDVYVTGGAFATFLDMDAVVIRYDSSGAVQWAETWDNDGLTDACGTITLDGGMALVTGFTQTDAVTWEYTALRFDMSDGSLLGAFVTNQSGTNIEQVTAVAFDDADNIYITGALGGSLTNLDIKTVKLDADLNIQWTATWNGTANRDDVGRGIAVDDAGNVYVAGHTTNGDDTRDALLLKYSPSGTLIWAEIHDADDGHDEFADVALTDDGSPFVGGYVTQHGNRDFYAALFDTSGTRVWSDWYNGRHNDDDEAVQITSDGLGNFLLAGPSTRPSGREVLTVKYARHTLVLPSDEGVAAPFVENRGQVLNTDLEPEDDIRYYTRQMYPNVYIFDGQVSYVFAHIDTVPASTDTMARIGLTFTGLQPNREGVAVGLERQAYHHNYYLGHIPEGRERVALENKVLQPSIYQNIDALYGQGPDGLFIRLICQPGSDPGEIRLQFDGHTDIWVDTATGALVLESALESLVLPAPEAMTIDDEGVETEIIAWQPGYVVGTGGVVSITTGSYDTSETLVVKVGREREEEEGACEYWSTYYGHTGNETAMGNDVDEAGNMYLTGRTSSQLFSTTQGLNQMILNNQIDAFAACFEQMDEFKWGTFWGGDEASNGALPADRVENSFAIKWRKQNNTVYFVGRTSATNFPLFPESGYFNNQTKSGRWSRGFIVKLDAVEGVRKWATFFGDHQKEHDAVTALHIGTNGNVLVGGYSFEYNNSQTAFPFFPSGQAGLEPHIQTKGGMYLAEFNGSNGQVWATKMGSDNYYFSASTPVAITDIGDNPYGDLYVTGILHEDVPANDPIQNDFVPMGPNSYSYSGSTDAFVVRFSEAREIVWSTYLGGGNVEYPNSLVCTQFGDFYVTGTTFSDDFPTQAVGDANDPLQNDQTFGGNTDIFIARFMNEENFSCRLRWSRYLGGPGFEEQGYIRFNDGSSGSGNAAALGQNGELVVTGTSQDGFTPIVGSNCMFYYPDINQGYVQTGDDAILTIIDYPVITFSTYWGGADQSVSAATDYGNCVSFGENPEGKAFVLLGGQTRSRYDPITQTGKTIPVCYEDPLPGSYYNDNFIGGSTDAYISKIYYAECLTTNVFGPSSPTPLLQVAPNPASDILAFTLPEPFDPAYIRIFDVSGKDVSALADMPARGSEEQTFVRISRLPAGFYWMIVSSGNSRFVGKFIKL